MPTAIDVVDQDGANRWLRSFSSKIRERGQKYLDSGRVQCIEIVTSGVEFRVTVRGSTNYVVTLLHEEGWGSICDCPYEWGDCKHAYAAMKQLLFHAVQPALDTTKESVLEQRLQDVLPRDLKAIETQALRHISRLHRELGGRLSRRLSTQDLTFMGIEGMGNYWQQLNLWDELPCDDYQFWLHIACHAADQGWTIPSFLEPISDFSSIRDYQAKRQRRQVAEGWCQFFGQHRFEYTEETARANRPESNLRLCVRDDGVMLELRRPEAEEFAELTLGSFRDLMRDWTNREFGFDVAGELLWMRWCARDFGDPQPSLEFSSFADLGILHEILDTPRLRELLVNEAGQPLPWPDEPLRWDVAPPTQ
ncbi:MAG: SWIM zinc finger family protein, partial [Limisphaerales bacterium]